MNKKIVMSFLAATVVTISGCASFADMAGADSATLNASAAQGFSKMTTEARQKDSWILHLILIVVLIP